MTKNLNWEISSKNLVTFKRWDGVNDKKFKYYGTSLKNPGFFGVFFLLFLWALEQNILNKYNCSGHPANVKDTE